MAGRNEPEDVDGVDSEKTQTVAADDEARAEGGGDDDEVDDLEDEFADFIDEELGYADIDWDTLPQELVDEHERIRGLSTGALAKLDLDEGDDLRRWAAARAYLAHGEDEAFESLADALIDSKTRSQALDYTDIVLGLMGRQARRGAFDDAFATLARLKGVADNHEALQARFKAILSIQSGKREEGLDQLASLAEGKPDDAHYLLSIGEDLCGVGEWEAAVEYLEAAEELARASADNDLLSSIENAAQFAQRHIEYGDPDDHE